MYKIPTVSDLISETSNGNHKFEVVSTFAGGGGSSTGYRMAGGKVLAVNEFIPEAINTYKSNWPDTEVIGGDIRQISAFDILNKINKKCGELDIFDGSPPCSAFSTAGARDKNWGKTKKYSDSSQSNVEDLFFEYIRLLRDIQPKCFIAENVSGLVKGTAKGYFNQIIRAMKECGYKVSCRVLDAKFLGVPQSRSRTIFIGIRNDLWRREYEGMLHPKPKNYIVTLEEAFSGLIFTEKDNIETDIKKFAVYRELLNLRKGEQSKKYFQLVKADPKRFSGCITATTGNKGAASIKHWDNRSFTVSEVKRIMSIPDDYILTGTYQQQVERLGRMVAPFMMKAVAENLLSLGIFDENTN